MASMEGKRDTLGARFAEPCSARLRAADESMIVLIIDRASKDSDNASELRIVSSRLRSVFFKYILVARFPLLPPQVFGHF